MNKLIGSIISCLFLISCLSINTPKLAKTYVLDDKYMYGKINFDSSGRYTLNIQKELLYRESAGTYYQKRDTVFLTSTWQPDTILIKESKVDTVKSLNIVVQDFDSIPLVGKVILNKNIEFEMKNGKITISQPDWNELWILTYNFYRKKMDTIALNNKGYNSYLIKKINTFTYYNYLFFTKEPFLLKGKKLFSLSGLSLKYKQIKIKSK